MTAEPTPGRQPRRRRRRPNPAAIPAPDPTEVPPSPGVGLVLKYDTRDLDPRQVTDVIDLWRRHGWTE